jgi:predicted dehydrogenase
MKTLTAIIMGCGSRGSTYAWQMTKLGEKYRVVGIAEPSQSRRDKIKKMHNIPEENCYHSWDEILDRPKMADLAIISMLDDMHYEPALKAIELGYDILLEKPIAQTAKECADIALAAKKKGVKVLVCHVLRYTPFYDRIKEIVMDGKIGDIVSVIQVEGVGNVHQSHSYVRGNWHSEEETTPMLLAKCCHDLDIIQWLIDKPCKNVQSFGSLTYFTEANAPEGAPIRCADGTCPIKDTCEYNCMKLYYHSKSDWFRGAAAGYNAKGEKPTDEEVLEALKTTDYGLCVFHANNDVVDHQVVNMEFEGGVTASLTMNAFNLGGRYIRLFGTKGELYANMSDKEITLSIFEGKKTIHVPVTETQEDITGGHGGGDIGIIRELYEYINDEYDGYKAANIEISAKNHLIGFAAEKSRRNNSVESVTSFMDEHGMKND